MKRYCYALDLIDDKKLIEEYVEYHKNVWPEILEGMKKSGVTSMEIYLIENRLFLIMDADKDFTFEKQAEINRQNKKEEEWQTLMWKYQKALPTAKKGEKWLLMDKIFDFKSH